jgi:hypothetical protein
MEENKVEDTKVEGSQEQQIDWKAKAAELEAEATKQRNINKQLITERDSSKKATVKKEDPKDNPEVTEYLKNQLEEVSSKISKYAEKAKAGAIASAATSKLTAMGINGDAIELAIKQLDKSLIEYDEDTESVDDTALSAAVSKLKSKYGFLFETRVGTTKARMAADGSSKANGNLISIDEWASMSSKDQRIAIKAGRRLVG